MKPTKSIFSLNIGIPSFCLISVIRVMDSLHHELLVHALDCHDALHPEHHHVGVQLLLPQQIGHEAVELFEACVPVTIQGNCANFAIKMISRTRLKFIRSLTIINFDS